MMDLVPDFHVMVDDYSIPTTRPKKPATGGEGIVELLWQNGQVVMQSQNQKQTKKTAAAGVGEGEGDGEVVIPAEREIRLGGDEQHQLFMQEDEMASWLQYPLDDSSFDRDLYADFLYSAPPLPAPISTVTQPRVTAEIRPPPPAPPRPPAAPAVARADNAPPRLQNFVHFSRLPVRPTNQPAATAARESTVVESNETPMVRPEPRVSQSAAESRPQVNADSGTATATAGELAAGTCDLTVSSSPGGSRASFSASGEAHQKPAAPEDRKRKTRDNEDNECQSEDIEFEAAGAKKQARGSASAKRSRAAEVHNLSERRRRDRINEKMRALQELIPRCNKSDKASMLDEAIEYLKSLQMQVQMMSMGCPMVPMLYPGMQQYMPAMGLGMGMNRPMVPYPSMLPGPSMTNPANMGPQFPLPPAAFHMPQVHVPDPSRVQASNQTEPGPNFSHYQNQQRIPSFVDPYQQFFGMHQGQVSQNQAVMQPDGNKPSTGKETGNTDNQQFG